MNVVKRDALVNQVGRPDILQSDPFKYHQSSGTINMLFSTFQDVPVDPASMVATVLPVLLVSTARTASAPTM